MTAAGSSTPAPPRGPGVRPPFVAPPTDGARQRRWLAVGLASAAVLLCCVGGLFGMGGLVVLGNQMVVDQARGVVTDYLNAIKEHQYRDAYDLICDREREQTSLPEFSVALAGEPQIESFELRDPVLDEPIVVPATLRFRNGAMDDVRYLLEQERSTGEFRVCGKEG
jgi:hypothetical protein